MIWQKHLKDYFKNEKDNQRFVEVLIDLHCLDKSEVKREIDFIRIKCGCGECESFAEELCNRLGL
jgi:hypothetical protein